MAKKVSFFVHDLGSNPIVRAAPFARAFTKMGWEVEILGFSYTYNEAEIYPPYKDLFSFKVIRVYNDIRWVLRKSWELAKMAEGDVIYAFKPKWTTLMPALIASGFGMRKRLIMDAEDNELWDSYIGYGFKAILKNHWYVENPLWNMLLHPVIWFIKRKTVACRNLKKRYGGQIVQIGPIDSAMEKISCEKIALYKEKFKLPAEKRVVLFAGRPANYNGIVQVARVLREDSLKGYIFVLAGDPENRYFQKVKKILGDRCFIIGMVPHSKIDKLISCADVIPIFQSGNKNTEMQLPAKFTEALAYGVPTIVTNVSDLGSIVSRFHSGETLIVSDQTSIESALTLSLSQKFRKQYACDSKKYYDEKASINSAIPIFESLAS